MPKDAYYFPHDSNAKDDPKCVMLIELLGLEGYGIYWVLIETLRDQPGYKYPLALVNALARKYNTTAEKMKSVINSFHLFSIDCDYFYSDSLIKRMSVFEEKREQSRTASLFRWHSVSNAPALPEHTASDADALLEQSGTNPSKVNKSKSNESKVYESKNINASSDTSFGIPEWIDIDLFNSFVEMRKKIKAPLTEKAKELVLNKLYQLRKIGNDPNKVLEQSILHSWRGIFALRNNGGNGNGDGENGHSRDYGFNDGTKGANSQNPSGDRTSKIKAEAAEFYNN